MTYVSLIDLDLKAHQVKERLVLYTINTLLYGFVSYDTEIPTSHIGSYVLKPKAVTLLEKRHRVFVSKEPIRIRGTMF